MMALEEMVSEVKCEKFQQRKKGEKDKDGEKGTLKSRTEKNNKYTHYIHTTYLGPTT